MDRVPGTPAERTQINASDPHALYQQKMARSRHNVTNSIVLFLVPSYVL